jgi:hypothetical protein
MKNTFGKLMALVLGAGLAGGLGGCGARPQIIRPEVETGAEKPAPRGKKSGPAAVAKSEPGKGRPAGETKPNGTGDGVRYADDSGGKLLAALLPPHRTVPPVPAGSPSGPRRPAGLPHLERPELPLPPNLSGLPRPPLDPPVRPVRPRSLAGGMPLGWYRSDPDVPQRQKLPASAGVRLPSVDVNRPVPLAVLGQAQPDRALLTDPAPEVSREAALAGAVPPRTIPVPFLRLNLPDPFEHRRAVRLRNLPDEEKLPVKAGP